MIVQLKNEALRTRESFKAKGNSLQGLWLSSYAFGEHYEVICTPAGELTQSM